MLNFVDDNFEKNSLSEQNNSLNGNSNNNIGLENTSNGNSVNALLPLDEDRIIVRDDNGDEVKEATEGNTEEVNPGKIVTKHDFVSSPWTKLSIVGGFFALGFSVVYLSLNSLMGGGETASKPVEVPTVAPTPTEAAKDGDAYAKLALQKQESDLKNLNGKEETTKEEDNLATDKDKTTTTITKTESKETTKPTTRPTRKSTTTTIEKTQPSTPVQRTTTRNQNTSNSTAKAPTQSTIARVPSQRSIPRVAATVPKNALPNNNRSSIAFAPTNSKSNEISDPLTDIERLRNLTSMGRIEYNKQIQDTTVASDNSDSATSDVSSDTIESRKRRDDNGSPATDSTSSSNATQGESSDNENNNEIQQLTPRWEPSTDRTIEFSAQNKQKSLVEVGYLQEESQILEERAPQYLVIGSSTNATLVTPLLIAGDKPNKNLRFVAQLTEPIKSNTGAIAIPAGTQVSIKVNGVDGGFGMDAEVVGILKDGTEYPIAPGTITVLAAFGNPLIARPYKGKGGEIAGYDMTLGSIAGLAKVGEIINRQDETVEDLPLGGTRTRQSGGDRNISGAFLEGAFGALATSIGTRTQTATTEVTSRPNVWYVAGNSKITLRVNRSIKL